MKNRRPTRPSLGLSRRAAVAAATAAGLLAGLAATVVVSAPGASAATVTAPATTDRPVVSAGSFIDSVGINVHTYYNDTAYADNDRTIALLNQLGIRHVRDGLVANRPDQIAAIKDMGDAGISSTLIVGGTKNAAAQTVDPAQLSALASVAGDVDAVEPTNEYDCSGDPSWAAHQRTYAQSLVQSLQAADALRKLGVFGPAFCRPESVAEFGSVNGVAAVSNAHDYAGGQPPELALESRLPAWSATQNDALPMALTETGYTNALNATPTQNAVTETTAADYTVRTLLEASRLGIVRTYLYELLDEKPESALRDPEQHFGLVRADGTVKPAFTAVRNLLSDLALGSPADVPAGPADSSDVTSVRGGGSLLRTMTVTDPSGGGETLALWLATPVENTTTHKPLTDTARNVRVQVDSTHTATTRDPSRDNTEVSLGSGTSFTVPVDGGVTLLHLAPTTTLASATSSCTTAPTYAALAGQLGAVATSDLANGTGWTGSPAAATDLPDGLTGGARITAANQQRRIAVPGSPTSWTLGFWERTDTASANFSVLAKAVGASGGLVRTYDTTSDAPSHMQLSGYGLPASGANYGSETFGQARVGTWHFITLSVGSGTATFAVDGVVQGTVASGNGALTGVDVGTLSAGFRGSLAGLSVFKRVLSTDELSRLATTSAGSCTNATTSTPATRPTSAQPASYGISSAAATHR